MRTNDHTTQPNYTRGERARRHGFIFCFSLYVH